MSRIVGYGFSMDIQKHCRVCNGLILNDIKCDCGAAVCSDPCLVAHHRLLHPMSELAASWAKAKIKETSEAAGEACKALCIGFLVLVVIWLVFAALQVFIRNN